jgi:hypothetical protein
MSLIILPIMALIFTTLPDEIFKDDLKIVGATLVIAEDDVAANERVKKNSSNSENAFE